MTTLSISKETQFVNDLIGYNGDVAQVEALDKIHPERVTEFGNTTSKQKDAAMGGLAHWLLHVTEKVGLSPLSTALALRAFMEEVDTALVAYLTMSTEEIDKAIKELMGSLKGSDLDELKKFVSSATKH